MVKKSFVMMQDNLDSILDTLHALAPQIEDMSDSKFYFWLETISELEFEIQIRKFLLKYNEPPLLLTINRRK